ncbi:biotin--[acetyl-CoA-carboxylase] ligase [Nocardioides sp. OK12]|uniref:biotin--[acetyl-CoA-carboxylase] ligase n=1 Tax=Nocardioides sp. OK12 TaxID=2758661 RepID=UPI0021C3B0EB|nr:biotin--[acetyl-CoA-carboxylase] ligase [Nocardioides sp. OK12]
MPDPAPQRPPLDDPLDVQRLAGAGVEVVAQSPSTNALVADRARAGAPEGLVVVTEHQTAGRGRLDRTWSTPARSALTFSLLLRPRVAAEHWPWLPLLTGHAVGAALGALGYPAGVKWPNDVLVEGRKLAGILVERVETPTGPAAVLGIGLNVRLPADLLPVPTATSLLVESQERGVDLPDRSTLLLALLERLRASYDEWQGGGEAAAGRLRTAYADACVTLGLDVRVELPGADALEGGAVGIDRHGRLLVQPVGAGGAPVAVSAGDVVHVRVR